MALGRTHRAALGNIAAMVRSKKLVRKFKRLAARLPQSVKGEMGKTVAIWEGESIKHAPIGISRSPSTRRSSARGPSRGKGSRGMLRSTMQGKVRSTGRQIIGYIFSPAHYAIWLAGGTRTIARGDVMAWREGDPPIHNWAAKDHKPASRQAIEELPIILPYRQKALTRLIAGLRKRLLKG